MPSVLVTGGSRGIGLATAKKFADAGYEVAIVARHADTCSLKGARTFTYDLADIEGIPDLVRAIGHVDVLVNNAGIIHSVRYEDDDYSEEEKRRILRINLEAPVALMAACGASMKKKKHGRIVNVTSVAGSTGHPDVWYGVTKAGLINATKSFARKLGPYGIIVTSVAPGPVETDMLHSIAKERLDDLRRKSISGTFATPEQIAAIIYWLATDAPDQVNGSSIDANNGSFPR